MLALVTFYPFDDSYFQFTGNSCFYNLLGKKGALLSDFLFFIFGVVAYIVPCIMFFLNWIYFLKKEILNLFELSNAILGSVMLLFGCCGLAECLMGDFYYCFSGGIIGFLLRTRIFCTLSDVIFDIIFLLIVTLGSILLTKYSFMSIFKKIANLLDCYCTFLKKVSVFFFRNRKWTSLNEFIIFNMKCFTDSEYYQNMKDFCKKIIFSIFKKAIYVNRVTEYINNSIFLLIKKYFVSDMHSDNLQIRNIHFIRNLSLDKNLIFNKFPFNTQDSLDIFLKKKTIDDQYKNLGFTESYNHFNIYFLNNVSKNKQLNKKGVSSIAKFTSQSVNNILFKKERRSFKKVLNFLPSIDLLFSPPSKPILNMELLKQQSELLELKLKDYHIQARVVNIVQGPVITRFELDLAPGLKSARISNLSRDLARSLSLSNLKVTEIIPGTPYIGLEIPNQKRETIYLREILDSKTFKESSSVLTLGFGKSISNKVVIASLDAMPHLLIAGTTGSGKSVGINSMIMSILYKATPEDVRFIMIDPKILELSIYEGIPHLLMNVVTDVKDIIHVLNWCVEEMDRRYKLMASCGARNLKNYNDRVMSFKNANSLTNDSNNKQYSSRVFFEKLPYIVIIVDEFSDLIISDGKQVEVLIIRLSQKARACGMHLILATQRPSVNVITGLIKANIPGRIAFAVSSKIDSRTILDQSGAESLLGMGDMLYLPPCSFVPIRVHGAFVCDEEVSSIVKHWKNVYI